MFWRLMAQQIPLNFVDTIPIMEIVFIFVILFCFPLKWHLGSTTFIMSRQKLGRLDHLADRERGRHKNQTWRMHMESQSPCQYLGADTQCTGWHQALSHWNQTLTPQSKSFCLRQDAFAIQRRMQRRGTSKCGSQLKDYGTVRCCYFYCHFLLYIQSQVCLFEWQDVIFAFFSNCLYKANVW